MTQPFTLHARDLTDEHVGRQISWSTPDPYDDWTNHYSGELVSVVKTWDPCGWPGCPCRSYVWVKFSEADEGEDGDPFVQTIGLRYGDEVHLS